MIRALVTATTAFAALAGLAVLLGTGSWRWAMRVLLDLLTAAGLLRLAGDQGWTDLAAAAAIVLLRRLLWAALTAGRPPGPGRTRRRGPGRARPGPDDPTAVRPVRPLRAGRTDRPPGQPAVR